VYYCAFFFVFLLSYVCIGLMTGRFAFLSNAYEQGYESLKIGLGPHWPIDWKDCNSTYDYI
jgi:hypothetical protein